MRQLGVVRKIRTEVFRYTPRSFHRAMKAGIFGDRKVEMIEGIPYVMGTNPPHIYTVYRLAELLRVGLPRAQWSVMTETMIALASSCPIPDVLVLAGPAEDYMARKITPADIRLIVEVCDSSWAKDVREKLPAYARSGIPECWLVRLRKRHVYRYTEPSAAGYAARHIFEEGERIPVADATLAVADFLPRPA